MMRPVANVTRTVCNIGLVIACVLTACTTPAPAAVFQYSVPVHTRKGERPAYLWLPPYAERVRGVVMCGMTLMERELVKDPRIRRACADQQLAIVFMKTGLKSADLPRLLADLAKASGYQELAVAPLMFIGHSAGGPQARDLARTMNERCFGLVQYRGGSPVDNEPVTTGVPCLMMIGQFDEFGKIGRNEYGVENWEKDRDKMAAYRALDPRNLGAICVEPGGGHFAWSDRNAEYLALFIPKAAKARIPADWPVDAKQPVALKTIDPASGWLTDMGIKPAGKAKPAPYNDYRGDKTTAAWHFDRELAEANVAYHRGIELDDQFIKWNEPYWVEAGARIFLSDIEWIGDGQTFRVKPAYAPTYPTQIKGRGSRWGSAGKPVSHAKAPIRVKQVGGPIVRTAPHTFRIQFDALAPATGTGRVTFMAYSEGDATHRYTERIGMLPRKALPLTEGKPQTITFAQPANLRVGGEPVALKATSDANLPVEFHVASGPAVIRDGKLSVAGLPKRARFPITVKVVAYQFGRAIEPHVQSAEPVVMTVMVEGR